MIKKLLFASAALALAIAASGYTIRTVFLTPAVTATGYLEPAAVTQLNFAAAGRIMEVKVRPGDVVRAGQVVVRQDTTALEAQLTADEATLAAHQAAVAYGQNPVRAAEVQALQLAVAAEDAQLAAAQARVADTAYVDNELVANLAASVESARATLASDEQQAAQMAATCSAAGAPAPPTTEPPPASDGGTPITPPPPTTTTAPASVIASCSQLVHQITQDQARLTEAIGAYEQAVADAQLRANNAAAAVTTAAAERDGASNGLAVGLLPDTPAELAAAEAAVASDMAAITADRRAIDDATLVAPADAVIGTVGGTIGEIAGPDGVRTFSSPQALPEQVDSGIQLFPQQPQGQSQQQASQFESMISLGSLDMKVVAQVSETDLSSVGRGTQARVTFPALPDRSVKAVVERVDPRGVNVNGRVYVLVDLTLEDGFSTPDVVAAMSSPDQEANGAIGEPTLVAGLTANVKF